MIHLQVIVYSLCSKNKDFFKFCVRSWLCIKNNKLSASFFSVMYDYCASSVIHNMANVLIIENKIPPNFGKLLAQNKSI